MNYPNTLKYTKEHEWAELINETQIKVGITAHAQNSLGDIVYLDLPKAGRDLKAHETFGVVESIKAVSDLYSPLQGKVVQANEALTQEPSKINQDPHQAWMIIIEASNAKEQYNSLMSSSEYTSYISTL